MRMRKGFTLIELLIVIGILAALAMAVLPSLSVSRQEALSGINQYNKGTTLKTLKEYYALFGKLPEGLHTGLVEGDSDFELMSGITGTMAANAASNIVEVSALSTGDAAGALESIGLGHIAVGTGNSTSNDYHVALGYTHADDASVIQVTNAWKTKSGDPLTFNGNNITSLASEGVEAVIALYVSPTVNWASGQEGGNSWAKAVKEYSLDVVGKNPLADNDEFNYYIAYIGLLPNGVYKATTTATGVYLHPTGTLSGAKSEAEEHLEDAGWEVDDDDWVDDTNGGSTAGLVGIAGGAHVGKTAIVTITFDDTPSAKLLGITDSDCEPINP